MTINENLSTYLEGPDPFPRDTRDSAIVFVHRAVRNNLKFKYKYYVTKTDRIMYDQQIRLRDFSSFLELTYVRQLNILCALTYDDL